MPQYRNPFEKGDLYIKFDVQFPESNWISPEKLNVSFHRRTSAFMHFIMKWCLELSLICVFDVSLRTWRTFFQPELTILTSLQMLKKLILQNLTEVKGLAVEAGERRIMIVLMMKGAIMAPGCSARTSRKTHT